MRVGRVVGTVVATRKNRAFEGAKLLIVQPVGPDDRSSGTAFLAIDSVGAGVGEKVLVVLEGRAAGESLRRALAPVDAAIVGIIDQIEYPAAEPATGAVAGDRRQPPAERRSRRRRSSP